ncbi:TonB-dependent receptor domain-containing protein [Sphingomonas kyeonggiensis]|uniref:TonB-dependent receptor domain-containing protein n=1 Tax=Sphingomonas kyeonggiensis TaxID=1268553 RepID=UPI0027D81392|nr:TonB-dependent receptor [Sphingomonas kyeonggiensis]
MGIVRGRAALLGATACVFVMVAPPASAQKRSFDVSAQAAETGIVALGHQADIQIIAARKYTRGKRTAPVRGEMGIDQALRSLLQGTGLVARQTGAKTYVVVPVAGAVATTSSTAPLPTPAPAAGQSNAGRPAVQDDAPTEIIVTAQKREESIRNVPIAVSAFSAEALNDKKIEGGSELLRAVPNVTFSKSNFSMYNFSIRGIGTKAVSASSDPAVAVSFNNTPLVRNRLFESEFFDLQRVEVLRGPQGTLYGRNATAGVVNVLPALPDEDLAAELKLEGGNYGSMRAQGMVNVPLGDTLGVRFAGAWTSREGFDYNSFTRRDVNGRNLWSTRAIVQWKPSDRLRANLIWQHFEEKDNRSRTGKQLCTSDPGPAQVGNITITNPVLRGKLSQGCLPGSIYDDAAFGVPNAYSLVYLEVPASITWGYQPNPTNPTRVGPIVNALRPGDPYAGVVQSHDLREISTSYDPVFRARNDVFQLNLEFEPSEGLQLVSQTAYARDRFYSSQDYNRFVSNPIFTDSSQVLTDTLRRPVDTSMLPTPGGIYCDPQLGCSDRMLSADISKSRNQQWSQEFRLQSSFKGPLNFNVGINYLNFKSQDDYYVFNNMFTLISDWWYSIGGTPRARVLLPCALGYEGRECPYVDRNPMDSLDNQGHNYFLSQNGIRIKSWAGFGELYWKFASNLKLTIGLRYTQDEKVSTQVPSQLLLGGGTGAAVPGDLTGGRVNSGYPALPDIRQKWGEFTGRAVLDWKPRLGFTDDTLVYLSAARGYKGGGTNPPRVDFNPAIVQYQFLPQTFRPEFVNAFEIGTKNSFDGGRFTFNATGFFYDYKDYQISQIVDRIAFNENFGATSMGLEFEAAWRPSRAFRIDGNLGLLKTRLKKGSQSIDVMNRTQGDPDWMVLRPWIQVPSNCIAPRVFVEKALAIGNTAALASLCPGATRVGTYNPAVASKFPYYALTGFTYDPFAPYNPDTVGLNIAQGGSGAPNGGRGFAADLTGNELPNAPRWTLNVGAQYTFFLDGGNWDLTFRGDYYRQSKSFARIYNTEYDRLRAWDNINIAVTLSRPASDLTFQLYVKNLLNSSPITDFFTNSDDTGLTTNVFTLDPRIIGFSMMKRF